MWLLLAFIAVPLIEIALFIQVGGLIGLGWTLLIVLLTAILGTYLVRMQGAQALDKIKFHTVQAELSRVAASSHEHAEEAAKWACIARENGASEHHITAAEQDGHHFIARFGDDGA